jgi:CHASE2 domain-containing sensor protein
MFRKNFLFCRDVLITGICTFGVIGMLSFVFINVKFLSPFYNALKDYELLDTYYNIRGRSNEGLSDKDIILVNIGDADRRKIAEKLEVIGSVRPKIIGLDVTFPTLKASAADSALKEVFSRLGDTLVLASQIDYLSEDGASYSVISSNPFFDVKEREGFGNFLVESKGTVRYAAPFVSDSAGVKKFSFTSRIVKSADSLAFSQLLKRGHASEVIRYSESSFIKLDLDSIYQGNPNLNLLRNKYVLVGYLGPVDGSYDLEDRHLTPLNASYGGRSVPDMYGLEIHAHILNMILKRGYIREVPQFLNGLIAFVVAIIHLVPFLYFFVKKHFWFHAIAKSVQLLSALMIYFIAILCFHYFHVKYEPSFTIVAVVISVDALYLSDGVMKWLSRRANIQSYFASEH